MAKCKSGNNTSDLSEHNHNIHKFIEGLNIPQLNVEEQESLEKDQGTKRCSNILCRQ